MKPGRPTDAFHFAPPKRELSIEPHKTDEGRLFHIRLKDGATPVVGEYLGEKNGDHFFKHHGKTIHVPNKHILGYRPTVGQMHPRGQIRPDEDRLGDRNLIMLSSGDLSEPLARVRQQPWMAEKMAATTYEDEPKYESYAQNKEQLQRLGVPIVNSVDLSDPEVVKAKLKKMDEDARVHFQMPRVPRATPNYSTQKLVRDTAKLPEVLDKPSLRISITTPDPTQYAKGGHNRIYGLEDSSNALSATNQRVKRSREDDPLEEFGYTHKQSTTDQSTDAAEKRRKYFLEPKPTSEKGSEKEKSDNNNMDPT